MEGGSWERIEEDWDPGMYATMHKHWKENGPPVYMAVATYLGLAKPAKHHPAGEKAEIEDIMRKYAGAGGVIM